MIATCRVSTCRMQAVLRHGSFRASMVPLAKHAAPSAKLRLLRLLAIARHLVRSCGQASSDETEKVLQRLFRERCLQRLGRMETQGQSRDPVRCCEACSASGAGGGPGGVPRSMAVRGDRATKN